jgi:hypothetical protein
MHNVSDNEKVKHTFYFVNQIIHRQFDELKMALTSVTSFVKHTVLQHWRT